MRKLTTALATIGIGAVVAAGAISPAHAEGDVTVSVRVVDAKGQPIENITVGIYTDDTGVLFLGETDATGSLTASEDEDGVPISGGAWDFSLSDYDDDRDDAGTQYVELEEPVVLESGTNELGTKTLQRSSRVTGVLTAPSKRPIRNITMQLDKGDNVSYVFSTTDAKGRFRFGNLESGIWNIVRTEGARDDFPATDVGRVTVGVDQDLTRNVTNARVRCDVEGFKVSSTGSGKVKLSVRATASSLGLTNPKGRIVVKRGSKTVKTITVKTGKTVATTVTKQPKGKKVAYTATYSKGDCLTWSKKASVKVKK